MDIRFGFCYNAYCGLVSIMRYYSVLLLIKECFDMNPAKFSFPAVKGIQANMEYYVTMVPLDCIPKLFTFSDENMPPEVRSQRTLNKSRIPEMCNYILQNPVEQHRKEANKKTSRLHHANENDGFFYPIF